MAFVSFPMLGCPGMGAGVAIYLLSLVSPRKS